MVTSLLIAIGTGLFIAAAKPRTPEEYAAIEKVSPYLAKALIIAAALGPDFIKAFKVIKS